MHPALFEKVEKKKSHDVDLSDFDLNEYLFDREERQNENSKED
jgi:hypothetical protein